MQLNVDREFHEEFWSKVKFADHVSCWVWQGYINPGNGYGQIWIKSRTMYAHRVAVYLTGKEIPKGKYIDHLCRNKLCVNPLHLEIVTPSENTSRGWLKRRDRSVMSLRTSNREFFSDDRYNPDLKKKPADRVQGAHRLMAPKEIRAK